MIHISQAKLNIFHHPLNYFQRETLLISSYNWKCKKEKFEIYF